MRVVASIIFVLIGWLVIANLLNGTGQPAGAGAGAVTVQPGDTLVGIAARRGVSAEALARANGLSNPDAIYPGQQLALPSSAAVSQSTGAGQRTVQPGETAAAIAARYNLTLPQLVAANGLRHPDQLLPGQVLSLPGSGCDALPGRVNFAGPGEPDGTAVRGW